MESIRKAQIGNIRGTGDIVAEKVGRGENAYIKIYQREKKPFLIQTFFRLHDLCSKNHTNITNGLQKSSFKTEDEKNNYISGMLENIKNKGATNNVADYFLTQNNNVYKCDFHDFLVEKKFSLPDSNDRRFNGNQKMTSQFFRAALDQLKLNGDKKLDDDDKAGLVECYTSEQKYFSASEKTDFLEIYSRIKESVSYDDELINPLDFLYNKVVCGPKEIPYSDVKAELEKKLNVDACETLYKNKIGKEWDNKKDGSIVDFMLKNIGSDSNSNRVEIFLKNIFKELDNGKLLKTNERLFPCMQERMKNCFNVSFNQSFFNPK